MQQSNVWGFFPYNAVGFNELNEFVSVSNGGN